MDFASLDRRALTRYGPVDLLGMLAMLWIGELRHGNDPLTSPFLYIDTLIPFLVGWLVAAYALSAYGEQTLGSYRNAVGYALVAWFVGNTIGQGLRASTFFHGGTELSFFLVMFIFVGISLTAGRVLVITVLGD